MSAEQLNPEGDASVRPGITARALQQESYHEPRRPAAGGTQGARETLAALQSGGPDLSGKPQSRHLTVVERDVVTLDEADVEGHEGTVESALKCWSIKNGPVNYNDWQSLYFWVLRMGLQGRVRQSNSAEAKAAVQKEMQRLYKEIHEECHGKEYRSKLVRLSKPRSAKPASFGKTKSSEPFAADTSDIGEVRSPRDMADFSRGDYPQHVEISTPPEAAEESDGSSLMFDSPDRLLRDQDARAVWEPDEAEESEGTDEESERIERIAVNLREVAGADAISIQFVLSVDNAKTDYLSLYNRWLVGHQEERSRESRERFAEECVYGLDVTEYEKETDYRVHLHALGRIAGWAPDQCRALSRSLWKQYTDEWEAWENWAGDEEYEGDQYWDKATEEEQQYDPHAGVDGDEPWEENQEYPDEDQPLEEEDQLYGRGVQGDSPSRSTRSTLEVSFRDRSAVGSQPTSNGRESTREASSTNSGRRSANGSSGPAKEKESNFLNKMRKGLERKWRVQGLLPPLEEVEVKPDSSRVKPPGLAPKVAPKPKATPRRDERTYTTPTRTPVEPPPVTPEKRAEARRRARSVPVPRVRGPPAGGVSAFLDSSMEGPSVAASDFSNKDVAQIVESMAGVTQGLKEAVETIAAKSTERGHGGEQFRQITANAFKKRLPTISDGDADMERLVMEFETYLNCLSNKTKCQ